MSHQQMDGKSRADFTDTTNTKIFVGGLAWKTKRDSLERYFEQFGEIVEAVVIVDRNTGRSKGYGFVNFKDSDSAMRACKNPYPVIDGRRTNCNIAALGAKKNHPTPSPHVTGADKLRPGSPMAPLTIQGTSTYFHPQYGFPYPVYGIPVHAQDIYAMSHYNVHGGQQFPSCCYATPAFRPPAAFYGQNGQSNIPSHHPKMIIQQYRTPGIVLRQSSVSAVIPDTARPAITTTAAATAMRAPGNASEQKSDLIYSNQFPASRTD